MANEMIHTKHNPPRILLIQPANSQGGDKNAIPTEFKPLNVTASINSTVLIRLQTSIFYVMILYFDECTEKMWMCRLGAYTRYVNVNLRLYGDVQMIHLPRICLQHPFRKEKNIFSSNNRVKFKSRITKFWESKNTLNAWNIKVFNLFTIHNRNYG